MLGSLDAYVLGVVFLATMVRSAFGFGEALVAVPLLALRIPVQVAAPLAVLLSITVAVIVIAQDFRHVYVREAGWLVGATLFGIPVGLLLLTRVDERLVKAILAVVLIGFSSYSLLSLRAPAPARPRARGWPWLIGSGWLAGVLGGAYGMNGPPLAVYGALRRWPAEGFRATLQAYFLPASLLGLLGYYLTGVWGPAVTHDYLVSLPATLLGIVFGKAIHKRLSGSSFLRGVHLGLIGLGLGLLLQSVRP